MATVLTSPDWMRLLPPEMMAVLQRVEMKARQRKHGVMTGRHTSPEKGYSAVFAEHRPYSPGDAVRDIDWKVFARSDRYVIRQYTEETQMRATLVVDCSGSMAYQGRGQLSKLDYAKHLAAALARLFLTQQDAVGLVTLSDSVRDVVKASHGPSQLRRVLEVLHRTSAGGGTGLPALLHETAERIPPRGMVILLSDCATPVLELRPALHHLRHRHHELVVMQVLAEEELSFPFTSSAEFLDLEDAAIKLRLDPQSLRAAYQRELRSHLSQLERECGAVRARYMRMSTATPVHEAFSAFLAQQEERA